MHIYTKINFRVWKFILSNQIYTVISLSRMMWHQTEFHLAPNRICAKMESENTLLILFDKQDTHVSQFFCRVNTHPNVGKHMCRTIWEFSENICQQAAFLVLHIAVRQFSSARVDARVFRVDAGVDTLHREKYISISFHSEGDMIVVTVFLSILNQMEFYLVQNQKENCPHDHIPFNV